MLVHGDGRTDWVPTLAAAAGIDLASAGGFDSLDGVSHWAALTGDIDANDPARKEILFNIDGVNGTGAAAIRVGPHKLLRSQLMGMADPAETAAAVAFRGNGPPSSVPSLGTFSGEGLCPHQILPFPLYAT